MQNRNFTIVFTLLICISCARTEKNTNKTEANFTIADTHKIEEKPIQKNTYFYTAFIATAGSEIFSDTLLKVFSAKTKFGDSVEVAALNNDIEYYGGSFFFPNSIYKVVSLNGDTNANGYISGKNLGLATPVILTDNSKAFLIYHYLDWRGEIDEDLENNGEILLVKNNKLLARHAFTAYSDLGASQIREQKLKPAITLFTLNYGYPACGYTQGHYLFSWDGKTLKLVEKTYSMGDSGIFSNWSDWIFPGDSLGEAEHLVVRDYHFEVDENENDTILMLTGLRKYKYSNYNFTKVFADTIAQNLR